MGSTAPRLANSSRAVRTHGGPCVPIRKGTEVMTTKETALKVELWPRDRVKPISATRA